ncbi:MAG: DNA polymerase III subunit delta' [Aquisalimonadaceae bacterium]
MAEGALTELPDAGPPALLPWHRDQARRLGEALTGGRLPHALLICGPAGVGKRMLAEWTTALLLCDEAGAEPCGHCRGCTLHRAGSHPDLHRAGLVDGSQQVRIETIRELIRLTMLRSQYGARRVALISPADRMNRNAANTLLKTLEEPPAGAQLLLVADSTATLPQTVRSRCQQIVVAPPERQVAVDWLREKTGGDAAEQLLALCANAPLRARELAEEGGKDAIEELVGSMSRIVEGKISPVGAAAGWPKERLPLLLNMLTVLVQMLIRREASGKPEPALPALARIPSGLDLQRLHGYLDYLYGTQRLRDRALQPQLYVEDLLIRWQYAGRTSRH